ncbi:phosphatase PAP2 family protein [Massilia glaciei]|uniref:PAP2 family protein n=1 Tax=Massilia glaciei TaxID=1524097 RepID=A0A2U2I7P2_9BURK|nr:phosphatase PAP2 family protein [Massilia glaciei]PWF55760.1 PAP2 family protein [Massilia glaciei]
MKKPRPRTRLQRHIAARFSPTEAFGLHLTVGFVLMLLAGAAFGVIAADVVAGRPITLLDVELTHCLHRPAHDGFTRAMLVVTHLHSQAGVALMALLLAVYFHRRGARYWLLTLAAAVPGGMLLNVLLKYTFQRARPDFTDPLLTLSTYSFPSGHTVGATVFYGMLAAWLVCRTRSWPRRALAVAAACAMVALVGLSRMVLGVHYLSDVLAAVAEGAAWLAICITAGSTLRRRAARHAPTSTGETP